MKVWEVVQVAFLLSMGFIRSLYAWPTSIESIEWGVRRSLVEYKIYAAVNYDKIDIPPHSSSVNISVTIEQSDSSCAVNNIKIYASMFGLPVVSRDGEAFPNNTFITASEVHNVSVASNNKTVHWIVEGLLPGPFMMMAVMPRADSRIRQKGLHQSCSYALTTVANISHFRDEDILPLRIDSNNILALSGKTERIFSFLVPLESVAYVIDIRGCGQASDCPVNITLWKTLSSDLNGKGVEKCNWINGSCSLQVTSPLVNFHNYLTISSSEGANFTLDVFIHSSLCELAVPHNLTYIFENPGNATNCSFAGQLGRVTPPSAASGSTFFDLFVAWDDQLLPKSLINQEVTDTGYLVRRFSLRTTDTGSSLRVDMLLSPIEETKPDWDYAKVFLCLTPQRLSEPGKCDGGQLLEVNTEADKISKVHSIVPYPPGGVWYISLQSSCFQHANDSGKDVPISCDQPVIANITVQLIPCLNGGCNGYGSCNLYVGAGMLYSACDCYSGWRGYGCNDDSEAESASLEKLAVYLLTLSNLGFVPGICLAFYRRLYVEALIYTYNMFFSTFYHACDTSRIYQLCILSYNTLSFADFFASLMSFWVTLMSMSRVPAWLRSLLHVAGAVFIAVGEVHDRHGLLEQMLPLVIGISIMLLSWGYESYRRKQLFPSKRRLAKFIAPGISLAVLGLVLNLAVETEENYKYVHSSWHVLEATAICFLLPPHNSSARRKNSEPQRQTPQNTQIAPGGLSIQSGDIRQSGHGRSTDDAEADLTQVTLHRADGVDGDDGDSHQSGSPTDSNLLSFSNGLRLQSRNSARNSQRNLVM